MPQQSTFEGFGPAGPTDRLFLALFPDAATAGHIAALAMDQCARHGLRGRPLHTARFHVTLFHLGDSVGLRSDVVEAVRHAGALFRAAPFAVAFDRVESFPGKRHDRPFVLKADGGNDPLRAFHARLGDALRVAGQGRWVTAGFQPHVTLAYDPHPVASEPVAPVSWMAREFVLVHSLLGQTRHVVLERWPLDGR